MVFSSHIFLFYFLPLALALYFIVGKKWRNAILTLSSYVFYGWGEPSFVLLLLLSTCIDWCCGLVLMDYPHISSEPLQRGGIRTRKQKIALWTSVVSNLSLLGFFKYCDFGISNWNLIVQSLFPEHGELLLPLLHISLPLGISFYTFQSMSYTIDVYRGDAKGITNIVDFACYVSLFPQLVAGPIVRFQEVANQMRERVISVEKFARGIAFFILGMAQKILLANPCGQMADASFDHIGRGALEAWWGLSAYSLQIFFDFAGYSNMAIGLGLMLGFVFPRNFNAPYRSASITEFWRRWHISLSTWLRDYLYIPLGGNRKGKHRTYLNLFLVMFFGGLWHGASWTFVAWGSFHGLLLLAERAVGIGTAPIKNVVVRLLRQSYTLVAVMVAWVFFRSDDMSSAWNYLKSLVGIGADPTDCTLIRTMMNDPYHIFMWTIAAACALLAPSAWSWTRTSTTGKWVLLFALFILSIWAMTSQSYNPFIYFIF